LKNKDITVTLYSYGGKQDTVCFFEVRFLAALASWLCCDELGKKFGQQFF